MPALPSTPFPDSLIWLTWVAAHSRKLVLATGILVLAQRNPLVLAKELATLDQLSVGRLQLGVGVGWLEEEFDALGVPWAGRGRRTDEYIEVMRTAWATDHATYQGELMSFTGVSSNPKPVKGSVPIVVGGHSRAAAERAGRLGDGFFPGAQDPAELAALIDMVRQAAADAGRDPLAITTTAFSFGIFGEDPVAAAEELASIGVSRILVPAPLLLEPSPAEAIEAMGECIVGPLATVTTGD
jgi:probable F420-dependent oxidoreductase